MRMMVEFEKMGRMSWFSHLDLQSTMQRALRRAGLPVRYSQGYNPHVNLSFATALPVGCQSRCEILDVELSDDCAPEAFLERLNECLPDGLKAHRAGLAPDNAPALMALMTEAEYEITVPGVDVTGGAAAFRDAQEVVVEKRSKTKTREVNIRPMVHVLDFEWNGSATVLHAILEQTNANGLKAELLMQAIAPDQHCQCVRTAFYAKGKDGQRVGLFEAGLGQA